MKDAARWMVVRAARKLIHRGSWTQPGTLVCVPADVAQRLLADGSAERPPAELEARVSAQWPDCRTVMRPAL